MIIKNGKRGGYSIWQCDECGKHFEVFLRRANEAIKHKRNMFCSPECRKSNWKKTAYQRLVIWSKDEERPNFKGGIGITTDGYVWIRIKGRARNQIKLHRYLMEIKIGRKLLPTEIVHHINGEKFDNRIENLEIVTRKKHNKINKFLENNRKDIYTEEEVSYLVSGVSIDKFLKKYPNRTRQSAISKISRRKKENYNEKQSML